MKEKLKGLRLNISISAVISIIAGILLVFYPAESLTAIGRILALFIILAGAATIISQFINGGINVLSCIVGGIIALVGIWMFISPTAIASIIPIAIGVVLLVHGIQDFVMAMEGARAHAKRSWIPFVVAVINIAFGLVCIMDAFGVVNMAMIFIGIMLVFDGLTDLGIVHKVRKATKDVVDVEIIDEEDIY